MDWQAQIQADAGRTFVIDAPVSERLVFLRKTYTLVLLGLGIAGVAGYYGATQLVGAVSKNYLLFFVGYIVACFAAYGLRKKPGINYLAFFFLTGVSGVMLGPLLAYATMLAGGKPVIVMQAVVITGVIITGLSAYVFITKKDFSFLRGALTIGGFALLAMIIVGFFWGGTGFQLGLSLFGALLFSGYVLYDTSRVVKTHPVDDHVGAAIDLYLDFFLLFLYILRTLTILAGSRD